MICVRRWRVASLQAWKQYGSKVDAVINVTYRTEHDGNVFASGLAVHFVEQQSPPPSTAAPLIRSTEERLQELRELRDKGLITPQEYDQKRQDILKGL